MEVGATGSEDFLEELLHRTQIKDAILRYCRGIDRRDYALLRSAYHDDAFDDHGVYRGHVDGFIAWVQARHEHIEQSMHIVCNCLIERSGDVAVAETYCITLQRPAAGPDESQPSARSLAGAGRRVLLGAVRYGDRFERRDRQWKIAHRTLIIEMAGVELTGGDVMAGGDWVIQRRDHDDALWAIRAAAGLS